VELAQRAGKSPTSLSQPVKQALVDFRAATLNENDQDDDEQNTSNNLNNRGRIHEFLLFSGHRKDLRSYPSS
jgi:hypothetical protein